MCVYFMPPLSFHRVKMGRTITVAFLFACIVAIGRSRACDEEGIVRDAAFDQPRDVYRLCVIAQSNDVAGQESARRLKSWLETSGVGLNMVVVSVAADAEEESWSDYGIPSAPPELPVVVLVGRKTGERTSFVVDHWQPAPTDTDLAVLRSSPARDAIRCAVVKDLAVIIYAPGTNSDDGNAERVIEQVRNARMDAGLPGVSVVRVDRADARERLLLSFANVPPAGEDWVGVVFGRGKFMAPLEGDEITEAGLVDLLDALSADCTCTQSPSRLGVDVLMVWDERVDDSVIRLATSGETAGELFSVGTFFDSSPVESDDPDSWEMLSPLATMLWTLGGLALVSIVVSVGIAWRHRRM